MTFIKKSNGQILKLIKFEYELSNFITIYFMPYGHFGTYSIHYKSTINLINNVTDFLL